MIKWIQSLFNDPMGETSSKRVTAFILIVNGIVLGYLGGHAPESMGMITAASSLLITNGITKT